jgi:hypothetical protein
MRKGKNNTAKTVVISAVLVVAISGGIYLAVKNSAAFKARLSSLNTANHFDGKESNVNCTM